MNVRIIETPGLGRVAAPEPQPEGGYLFWTTSDFDGRLSESGTTRLVSTIHRWAPEVENVATCHQVHGARSVRVSVENCGPSEPTCDALWTRDFRLSLGTKVADCLPVTLIDSGNRTAVGIHAGWRGAAARIVTRTLEKLDPSPSPDSRLYLGPSIRRCCFEVGSEVVDAFRESHGEIDHLVDDDKPGNPHLDLAGIVTEELVGLGWARERIHDSGLCTRCEGSIFHSYRRSGANAGRNLAISGIFRG